MSKINEIYKLKYFSEKLNKLFSACTIDFKYRNIKLLHQKGKIILNIHL